MRALAAMGQEHGYPVDPGGVDRYTEAGESVSRLPGTLRVCSLPLVLCLALAGGPGSSFAQSAQSTQPAASGPIALVKISLMGSNDQVVVGLVGEKALSGEVQEISVDPFRIFVDFVNVVPKVDAVTLVERGDVRQVRVALNQADPPVTRVVLDLIHRTPYRVEEDPTNNEFRIIIGSDPSSATGSAETSLKATDLAAFSALSSPVVEYAGWFDKLATDLELLLTPQTDPLDAWNSPESFAAEWQRLRYELDMVTPPVSLQTAHELLATAIQLGDVSMSEQLDDRTPERDRATARAGAALLVIQARDLVEAELATTDSEQ